MDTYELLLDQITPFLESQFSNLPEDLKERISQAGMGEKTNTKYCPEVEEFDWVHIEAGNKLLTDEEAKVIEEGDGIRKGKGIRSKIKTEHYYIWDTLSALEREYKVARYDFENCPNHREKAASEKLAESIKAYLETKFSDLPHLVKMNIAYVDIFQKWDEISPEQREYLAHDFDARMQPGYENSVNIGFIIKYYNIKEYWYLFAQKKTLLADEAIPLMNGLDPDSWEDYKKNEKGLPKDMIRSIERCLKIALDDGLVKSAPFEWLVWGRIHGLDKPTIRSYEWLHEPDVCMWGLFESAVSAYRSKTITSVDSNKEQESKQVRIAPLLNRGAVRGLPKRKVMAAFQGIKWDYDHWGKNLANPSKKLEDCRVAQGNKIASALWNPVCIGLYLLDEGISMKKLDAIFVDLKDWTNEWQEKTELERD